MKQLKTIKRLTAFGLLVLMTACSTENTVIGNVGVSDVKSSGCKASASQLDSRPEYYNNFVGQKSVLHLTLGADNISMHALPTLWTTVLSNCSMLMQAAAREKSSSFCTPIRIWRQTAFAGMMSTSRCRTSFLAAISWRCTILLPTSRSARTIGFIAAP